MDEGGRVAEDVGMAVSYPLSTVGGVAVSSLKRLKAAGIGGGTNLDAAGEPGAGEVLR